MKPNAKLYQIEECSLSLGERWCDSWLVNYPATYQYNGGITVDEEWYDGYEVPPPKTPEGFELVGIGCGYQLNAHPPLATAYLKPLDGHKVSKSEAKQICIESQLNP